MKPGILLLIIAGAIASCNSNSSSSSSATDTAATQATQTIQAPAIKQETVTYTSNGVNMDGFIAFDSSKTDKRPGILIVHEWWGLNEYPKMRAKMLADLGYVALAVDMYGDGKVATDPAEATKVSGPFYKDLQMTKSRFDAALAKLKSYPQVDTNNIAAIGYCFGGGVVLNVARLGDNLKGVVSFHGTLLGAPAKKDLLKAKILVCHGGADQFVKPEEVAQFKKQMDSIGADYTFKQYPDATHAFTNPKSTENGEKYKLPLKYNPAADTASWNDMKDFFAKIFKQ